MAGQIGRLILKGAPKAAKLAEKFLPKASKAKNAAKATKATKNSALKKALVNKKVPNNVVGKQGAPKAEVNEPIKGLSIEHKPVTSAVNGKKVAIAAGAVAATVAMASCTKEDYDNANKREAYAEAESRSSSGSTARAEAEAHVDFEPHDPIDGNYHDHVEEILHALLGGLVDGVEQPGLVEKLDIYKAYDQVLYSGRSKTPENSPGDLDVSQRSKVSRDGTFAMKGAQVFAVGRTANPGETNASSSDLSYKVTEAKIPTSGKTVKLVHVNNAPADAASNLIVAINNGEHKVYVYPYLTTTEESEILTQEGRDAKINNYFKYLMDKAEAEGNPYEPDNKGAKDGSSSSSVAYTYYEAKQTSRGIQIENVIVTTEGTWRQIVAVNNADDSSTFLNDNRYSFMDNDTSNDAPDQHDPLPNGSKTGRKK